MLIFLLILAGAVAYGAGAAVTHGAYNRFTRQKCESDREFYGFLMAFFWPVAVPFYFPIRGFAHLFAKISDFTRYAQLPTRKAKRKLPEAKLRTES